MQRPALSLLLTALASTAPAAQDEAEAVLAWARDHAIPLDTPAAGHGFEDLEPLTRVVGDARIVALGEATHGTREIFQLKHRMLELLVERLGFTVFAIEASYPDCVAINEYVEHGVGDPAAALHGQGFWTWDTEEVLALIEWMRAYNADPEHERTLRFYGVDMQQSGTAMTGALEYVREHEPDLAEALASDLEPLTRDTIFLDYSGLPDDELEAIAFGLAELEDYLDVERDALVEATSGRAWSTARQHAAVASQAQQLMAGTGEGPSWRDQCMAANTAWILDQEPEGARVVLWAHNGHVKKDGPPIGFPMMGYYLAERFGAEQVVFGFAFHHGGFQAIASPRPEGDTGPGLRPFEVGPPEEGSIDALLGEVGPALFALDLRTAPAEGPVADWLQAVRPARSIGAVYSYAHPERAWRPTRLADQYDALFFLAETTPARPNPLTRERHGIPDAR